MYTYTTMTTIAIENKIPFIVESGNWKARVSFHPVDDEINNYTYIESCTRAFEYVFAEKDFDDDVQYISLKDKNGKEYLDVLYNKDVECDKDKVMDTPESVFGVITLCRLEDDENNKDKWWIFRTSKIIANAGLFKLMPFAEEMERRYKKEIDEIERKKIEFLRKKT